MKNNLKETFGKGLYLLLGICFVVLFYWFLERIEVFASITSKVMDIVKPFITGVVIAYLLFPVQDWIKARLFKIWPIEGPKAKKAEKREKLVGSVSIVLSILLFIFLLFELFTLVIPQTIESISSIVVLIPESIKKLEVEVDRLFSNNPDIAAAVGTYLNSLYESASSSFLASLNEKLNLIVSGISTGVISALNFTKDFLIGIIVAIYVMGGRKTFLRQAKLLIMALFPYKKDIEEGYEQKADWIFRETAILNRYMNGFIKGKIIDSLIIGLICLVFCLIVRMPYAVLVSVIVGVTNMIPFFGPFIGAIPSALIILMVSPVKCLVFIIFIIILQQLDGNVIGPHILGNATKLSSFWVLFAILLFGGLFGIPGMILGVPVFAFIYHLLKESIYKRLERQKISLSDVAEKEDSD